MLSNVFRLPFAAASTRPAKSSGPSSSSGCVVVSWRATLRVCRSCGMEYAGRRSAKLIILASEQESNCACHWTRRFYPHHAAGLDAAVLDGSRVCCQHGLQDLHQGRRGRTREIGASRARAGTRAAAQPGAGKSKRHIGGTRGRACRAAKATPPQPIATTEMHAWHRKLNERASTRPALPPAVRANGSDTCAIGSAKSGRADWPPPCHPALQCLPNAGNQLPGPGRVAAHAVARQLLD